MSLQYDIERCTGIKFITPNFSSESSFLCEQRESCQRYLDAGRLAYQAYGNGAVLMNEKCDKKIEVTK